MSYLINSMQRKLTCQKFPNLTSLDPIQHLFDLRLEVFHEEIGFEEHLEIDDTDIRATHFEARLDGQLVGTTRYYEEDGKMWIGRLTVKKEFRKFGVGKFLMTQVINEAMKLGFRELHLDALSTAKPFYDKMGAVVTGPEVMMHGFPHVPMVYSLE